MSCRRIGRRRDESSSRGVTTEPCDCGPLEKGKRVIRTTRSECSGSSRPSPPPSFSILTSLFSVFSTMYTLDSRFVLSGSDDSNLRIWKARASEKLGTVDKREMARKEYRDGLRDKWGGVAEVAKLERCVSSSFLSICGGGTDDRGYAGNDTCPSRFTMQRLCEGRCSMLAGRRRRTGERMLPSRWVRRLSVPRTQRESSSRGSKVEGRISCESRLQSLLYTGILDTLGWTSEAVVSASTSSLGER